jgi:hypothetical protein
LRAASENASNAMTTTIASKYLAKKSWNFGRRLPLSIGGNIPRDLELR